MNRRNLVARGIQLAVVALGLALAQTAIAQSSVQPTKSASPVGTWRGTSACLVRPSACNDEIVVYRITMKTADSLALDARKIVRGEEEDMGVLACHSIPATGEITCAIPHGVWHFRAARDSLTGELRLVDNTRFREVRAIRAP
jgi:hypothetical protein